MIPWLIVNIISAIASLFSHDVYVRAVSHGRGAERIYFVRSPAGSVRLRRLRPYRSGAPIQPGGVLTAGVDISNDRIGVAIEGWPAFARPTDPTPDAWPA